MFFCLEEKKRANPRVCFSLSSLEDEETELDLMIAWTVGFTACLKEWEGWRIWSCRRRSSSAEFGVASEVLWCWSFFSGDWDLGMWLLWGCKDCNCWLSKWIVSWQAASFSVADAMSFSCQQEDYRFWLRGLFRIEDDTKRMRMSNLIKKR